MHVSNLTVHVLSNHLIISFTQHSSDYAPAPELDYYDPAVLAADDDVEQVSYEERMRSRCVHLLRQFVKRFLDRSWIY
jgi:hypothetical protein